METAPIPDIDKRKPTFTRFFWHDPNTQFLGLAVLVGVLGAGGAILFRVITRGLTVLLMNHPDVVSGAASLPLAQRVVLPAIGGLIGGLIARRFVRMGGTMGIARIMEVVAVGRRTVSFRQSAARALSSLIVIATGGSEGREGPIIQLGAAFASLLSRIMKVSSERARVLVACGMAAGVAGAYNTPISGTLFVVEVVLGSFTMSVFGPAIISAFVSSLLTRAVLGNAPLYRVQPFELNTIQEYLPCLVIGLLTGFGSVAFMRSLRLVKKGFLRLGWRDEWRMGVGGLGVGILGIWFPQVWGNGFEGTNYLLNMQPVLWFFIAMFFLKMLATNLTVGSGGVGGVFTPALMCGAALGGVVAIILKQLFPYFNFPVTGYAVLGMGGFLAGITRAPFLSIIMMVELTQNENLVLPMMIVALLSLAGARVFERESVYVEELREAGVEWHETPESTALANLKVKDIISRNVSLIPQNLPLPEVIKIFLQTRAFYVFVGDQQGKLVGVIDLHDLKDILGDPAFAEPGFSKVVIASDVVREIPFVTPEESLVSANEKLWLRDLGWLPVVTSEKDRTFIGMITRRDVLGSLDREILRNSRFLARVGFQGLSGKEVDFFELPDQHRLMQIDVPTSIYGQTIAETHLRKRFGISILAILRMTQDGNERRFVPTPEDKLEKGDKLIVLATPESLARLQTELA
jgi:CIC family chloride channel protein